MNLKGAVAAILCVFFLCGCAGYEQRLETIRVQHPEWDTDTQGKVAARSVSPGMTREMTNAALGSPDSVSTDGDEELWGDAYTYLEGERVRQQFVFFVHFKGDRVVRTRGDTTRLQTLY